MKMKQILTLSLAFISVGALSKENVPNPNINNVTYKILILIDKKIPVINIGRWVEYNRYCPCYYNTPLLIECNRYYPYKKTYTTTNA